MYSFLKSRIFEMSFLVFIVLNAIENVLHYSIGRSSIQSDGETNKNMSIDVTLPSGYDIVKFLVVMIIFAFLQGGLTYYFNKHMSL